MKTDVLLLRGDEISNLLKGKEAALMQAVAEAYKAHDEGHTFMPECEYLRFPDMEKERIIAKPAYLGGDFQEAGLKWIASFPGNLAKGLERASATLILNSTQTGRPTAIMEGSVISAKRTGASAALAASLMAEGAQAVGLVGCGLINFETLRYLLHAFPDMREVSLLDKSRDRAETFRSLALRLKPGMDVHILDSLEGLLPRSPILSFGTTAVTPHVQSLEGRLPGTVVLHVSLRDLHEDLIASADNLVDDLEQVCSNKTSLHLAEMKCGHRDFVRATIGQVLNQKAKARDEGKDLYVFSPFGLGALDLAVGQLVKSLALEEGAGTLIEGFQPTHWTQEGGDR